AAWPDGHPNPRQSGPRIYTSSADATEHLRSTTLGRNPEMKRTMGEWHERNRRYYEAKWGAEGHEVHTTPFGDPNFGLKIAWSDRKDPYGRRSRLRRLWPF
ncbi:MAG: hypothetical protein K2Y56_11400, partial [Methylobacterium sp.]|uniref:hypothetical protein n=1 Tax=Methylobacterium sp. TaxID=409 RepID=UPI0025F48066